MTHLNLLEIAALVATPFLGFVGSWGGIRVHLKALRDELTETKKDVRDVRRRVDNLSDRVFGSRSGG